jgi:hypothetical protein
MLLSLDEINDNEEKSQCNFLKRILKSNCQYYRAGEDKATYNLQKI